MSTPAPNSGRRQKGGGQGLRVDTHHVVHLQQPVPRGHDALVLAAPGGEALGKAGLDEVVELAGGLVFGEGSNVVLLEKEVLVESRLFVLAALACLAGPVDGKLECLDLEEDTERPFLGPEARKELRNVLVAKDQAVHPLCDTVRAV